MLTGDVDYWFVGSSDLWIDVKDNINLYCVTHQGDQRRYDFDPIRLEKIKSLGILVGIRLFNAVIMTNGWALPKSGAEMLSLCLTNSTVLIPDCESLDFSKAELPLPVDVRSLHSAHKALLKPYFLPNRRLVLDDDLYTLLKLKL